MSTMGMKRRRKMFTSFKWCAKSNGQINQQNQSRVDWFRMGTRWHAKSAAVECKQQSKKHEEKPAKLFYWNDFCLTLSFRFDSFYSLECQWLVYFACWDMLDAQRWHQQCVTFTSIWLHFSPFDCVSDRTEPKCSSFSLLHPFVIIRPSF